MTAKLILLRQQAQWPSYFALSSSPYRVSNETRSQHCCTEGQAPHTCSLGDTPTAPSLLRAAWLTTAKRQTKPWCPLGINRWQKARYPQPWGGESFWHTQEQRWIWRRYDTWQEPFPKDKRRDSSDMKPWRTAFAREGMAEAVQGAWVSPLRDKDLEMCCKLSRRVSQLLSCTHGTVKVMAFQLCDLTIIKFKTL
jgi:hypothetical protein